MATTQNLYTGDGSTVLFSFTFPYLERTDIKVSVDNVNTTAYTLANATTVQFNAAPANGAAIRIYRKTATEDVSAQFYPGSAIRAQDLNDSFDQVLYAVQEIQNDSSLTDGSNTMVGNLDMGGYRVINNGAPTNENDAATKKYVDDRTGNVTAPGHTRWRYNAVGGETTLSGIGSDGGTLQYSATREQVFLNGALLQRGVDYTADNDTTIGILSGALEAGDVVDVRCVNNLVAGVSSTTDDITYPPQFTGAVTRTASEKLKDVVSVKDFGAVGDGVTDDTAAIQAAIDSIPAGGGCVYIPRGLYLIDPAIGINVVTGLTLYGDSRSATQLVAKPVAGTIIKRSFNPTAPNAYVDGVTIRDIGIILRHPYPANPSNYYQVAIQLRHITRSLVEDVYIGNYTSGASAALPQPPNQADSRQGYGVSIGSTSWSDPAYAGGEVNTLRRVMCSGVRYGFVIDDPTFDTPAGGSAAYTTVIDCCEVSGAEVGIAQYGQYGAGCTFSNNVIQAIDQMTGSSATAYSIYIDGYEHYIYGGYNESPGTDYELYLSASSKRNRVHTFLSDDGAFYDGGQGNVVERIDSATNKWSLKVNDRDLVPGIAKAWVSFHWDGSNIVYTGSHNIQNIVRIGPGDYLINFLTGTFADANYTAAYGFRVNVSGHPGTVFNYTNKAAANYRVLCYNITNVAYEDFQDVCVTFFGN